MALMRLIKDKVTGVNMHEGIVTYDNPGAAGKAVKTLNGKVGTDNLLLFFFC